MKWILFFGLCFLAGCASQPAAPVSDNSSNQNNSVNQISSNTNAYAEFQRINKENIEKLDIQNEKFKTVPEEFMNVDFENFTYPTDYPKKSVSLKNGEFRYEIREKNALGGGWFSFGVVYFVDFTGDNVKEAIVFLSRVDCGGSCDGGTVLMYVYQPGANQNRNCSGILNSAVRVMAAD